MFLFHLENSLLHPKPEALSLRIPKSKHVNTTLFCKKTFIWILSSSLTKNSKNYRSDVIHKMTHSNPTPFQSYTLPILHSPNLTFFQSYTLQILHSYNPKLFQSYTLPILHSSNPTLLQFYTLPISHYSNLTLSNTIPL